MAKMDKMHRCVMDVMKSGKDKSSSYAICTASIKGTTKQPKTTTKKK
jgi:hypothetical protein